jgi:hypothetical protein
VDFLDTSITQVPLNKLRRGGLCLLVNKGLQARVQLLDKQDGQLTTALWQISTGAWEYNLVLAGVYCSPNTTDTAPLKDQFETIERQMMPVPPAASGKYDAHVMLGDFNAKIGLQEPTPVPGLPKQ